MLSSFSGAEERGQERPDRQAVTIHIKEIYYPVNFQKLLNLLNNASINPSLSATQLQLTKIFRSLIDSTNLAEYVPIFLEAVYTCNQEMLAATGNQIFKLNKFDFIGSPTLLLPVETESQLVDTEMKEQSEEAEPKVEETVI